MWSGGEEYNDAGETVRLYQPILYGRKPVQSDPATTYVGGGGLVGRGGPRCALCQETTHHVVQLHVPPRHGRNDRTYAVFACNSAACFNQLFSETPLMAYGGRGVVTCRRVSTHNSDQEDKETKINQSSVSDGAGSSAWADEQTADEDDGDDWNVDVSNNGELDELEAKLAAMETSIAVAPASKPSVRRKNNQREGTWFPCLELHSLQEPHVRMTLGMDDEDVGVLSAGSDEKIRQMLAKYMAEEDDEAILTALRGSVGDHTSVGGGKSSERDERLSPDDKALLSYTDRLKRSPRQVIRYACGGVPLWSIPPPLSEGEHSNASTKRQRAKEQSIPPCSCGAPRVFEFQLLSSLLHVLQVDQFSPGNLESAYSDGGMNWGNIAVYTCSGACDNDLEEFVVIQESTEGRPVTMHRNTNFDPVVIADGTHFTNVEEDDRTDEDLEDDECSEDEDEL